MTTAALPAIRPPWWSRLWVFALVVLVVLAAVWFLVRWAPVAHWITYWTGQDDEGGGHYGFNSGAGGALPDVLIVTGLAGAYWHVSCHHSGCWLPGKHPSGDGSLKLCRWHHPDLRGRKVTAEVAEELRHLAHWRMHNAPARRQ